MDVEVVLFDGFDELDGIGPYEVLANGAGAGADVSVSTVTLEPTERVRASHGLTIEPDATLGDPDLLVVPGGGWRDGGGVRREIEDGRLPPAIAARHGDGTTVASVCTGALLLAEGGLLDGRPATTHAGALEALADVTDVVDARVVDGGPVLTAGGVTAGLDLAFYLLEREFGDEIADDVARRMEYERQGRVHRE